ncbi:hypothetical protein [Rhizobium sp. NXC24]|uniref:hypothetical protein n=1 Tax=Rhizobium sp. NXC24 TaxID=2048897 RepID=UPI00131A5706|nr:hypothetical protein [Rhizobium sp. NXC24]
MELQIFVEPPQEVQPTYHLTIGEITAHYRDVMSVLDAHGVSHDEAARHVGLSPTTLTAYGRGYGTAAHRRIPVETFDRIRDLAVDAYWKAAAHPYRVEQAGSAERFYLIPTWHAHDNAGLVRDRHPHPLRIREVADKLGGQVTQAWAVGIPTRESVKPPPLDAKASLRSRWRIGAWQLRDQFDYLGRAADEADATLCGIADCCRYSLWSFSTEYRPWMTQVTTSQVERLEAAVADIERGDEIQPFESAVQRAMADLEDF